MPGFVNVQVTTSATEAVAAAIERWTTLMQAIYPGWKPSPNDILTIAIEALGPLYSDAAGVAAVVPEAIFRRFGTKLEGIPYNEGTRASATVLFTAYTEGPHTIPQGTQVTVGTLGFYVEAETEIPAHATTAKVRVVAESEGTEYNNLTGAAELVESIDFIKEVALEGESSGGTSQETDSEYQERLASELALQAPRPVNAADMAPFLLGAPTTAAGVKVSRAVSKDLYDAATSEENVPFVNTTWATNENGEAFTTKQYEELEAWLKPYLPQDFLAFVKPPVYQTIYVTAKVHPLAGYSGETVAASVKAAVETLISKKNWGRQQGATTGSQQWILETKLRYNTVLGIISQPSLGVAYVFDGAEGLAIGTAPSPVGTADITLSGGPVVLPTATGTDVVVTWE